MEPYSICLFVTDWLISLSMISTRCIHAVAYARSPSFLRLDNASLYVCVCAQSCLTLCNPLTVAHQTPLSMGFSRQTYWSGLPFPYYNYHFLHTHSSLNGNWVVSTFRVFLIMLLWTWVFKYLFETLILILWVYTWSRISGLHNNSFNFLGNCHTVFHSVYTIL